MDSVVWLKPLDDCPVVRMHFGQVPFGILFVVRKSIGDGELNRLRLLQRTPCIPDGELEGQMVERGTEIVNGIAQDKTDAAEEMAQVGHVIDVQDVLAAIRLELHPQSWAIGFDRKRVPNLAIQGIAVFLAALNLSPSTYKGRGHGESFL